MWPEGKKGKEKGNRKIHDFPEVQNGSEKNSPHDTSDWF
jgi:hypothetical protein